MSKSINLATMLAVAGGLAMAVAPAAASASCNPTPSRAASIPYNNCYAKPKKAKKVKVAKAGCCAAKPGCCASSAGGCAPKSGCCAAKCGPKG